MEDAPLPPVEIPVAAVDRETLTALVQEFVLREGTDYGAVEATLQAKIEQVLRQLDRGTIKLFFEPATETVTIVDPKFK